MSETKVREVSEHLEARKAAARNVAAAVAHVVAVCDKAAEPRYFRVEYTIDGDEPRFYSERFTTKREAEAFARGVKAGLRVTGAKVRAFVSTLTEVR